MIFSDIQSVAEFALLIICILLECRTSTFEKSDAFIGFQDDTPASVVFQATNLLRTACAATKKGHVTKKGKWADIFKWSKLERRDCYIEENEQQALWEEAVRIHFRCTFC